MNPTTIDAILADAPADELADMLRLVDVFVRGGSMSQDEADEWRRRISAWREFLEL